MRARRMFLMAALAAASIAGVSEARAEGNWSATAELKSNPAAPGDVVEFTGEVVEFDGPVDPSACVVEIDGDPIDSATCFWDFVDEFSGQFPAPESIGNFIVSVCWPDCNDDDVDDVTDPYWQANVGLDVVAADVVVPDVTTCMSVREASDILTAAGLSALPGDAELDEVVTGQVPDSQELVTPGSPVSLIVGTVTVPDVEGSSYDDAKVELDETCLRIEATNGTTEGTVETQFPGNDTEVAGGEVVSVTMSGPTIIPPIVPPDSPPSEPASSDVRPVLVGAGVLLLVLIAASLLANRLTRGRRDLAWLRQHVIVAARPGGSAASATRLSPPDDDERDHIISVVGRQLTRHPTVKEEP